MEHVLKSIEIRAHVESVFEYLTDPANLLEIWPSMVEVTNPVVEPSGAHRFDWVYKMAGLRFHGHADTVELEPNRLRVVHNESGIPSTFRWEFSGTDDHAEVRLEVEYELPLAVLGRLAAPFLRRLNEREAETLLHNLKARMEERPGAAVEEREPAPLPP